MRLAAHTVALLALALGSCASTIALDERTLAESPPLPYRVALLGGAFLSETARAEKGFVPRAGGLRRVWSRTYPRGLPEPIPFADIEGLLRRGRVATRLLVPRLHASMREATAGDNETALRASRQWALEQGADLLLVIEEVREGPVWMHGVTGQWPVTTVAWLLVGLGMFIPDHRFESGVRLTVSVRDVHGGGALGPKLRLVPGTMDLALVSRTSFLGLLPSLIIPPTLLGNDVDKVVRNVRDESNRRLLLRLLARLKDPATREAVESGLPMRVQLRPTEGRRLDVEVETDQEVQSVAVEVFDERGNRSPLSAEALAGFQGAFLQSVRGPGPFVYGARLEPVPAGVEVRVLVQSVAGERVSTTVQVAR